MQIVQSGDDERTQIMEDPRRFHGAFTITSSKPTGNDTTTRQSLAAMEVQVLPKMNRPYCTSYIMARRTAKLEQIKANPVVFISALVLLARFDANSTSDGGR